MALDREGAAGKSTTFSLGREHRVERRLTVDFQRRSASLDEQVALATDGLTCTRAKVVNHDLNKVPKEFFTP